MAVRTKSKKVLICTCERETCGYIWESTTERPPLICPKCKSAGWNRKRDNEPEKTHA